MRASALLAHAGSKSCSLWPGDLDLRLSDQRVKSSTRWTTSAEVFHKLHAVVWALASGRRPAVLSCGPGSPVPVRQKASICCTCSPASLDRTRSLPVQSRSGLDKGTSAFRTADEQTNARRVLSPLRKGLNALKPSTAPLFSELPPPQKTGCLYAVCTPCGRNT